MNANKAIIQDCLNVPEDYWNNLFSLTLKTLPEYKINKAFAFADYALSPTKKELIQYGIALGFSKSDDHNNNENIDINGVTITNPKQVIYQHSLELLEEDISEIQMKEMILDADDRVHKIQKIQTAFRQFLLQHNLYDTVKVDKPFISYGAKPYFP